MALAVAIVWISFWLYRAYGPKRIKLSACIVGHKTETDYDGENHTISHFLEVKFFLPDKPHEPIRLFVFDEYGTYQKDKCPIGSSLILTVVQGKTLDVYLNFKSAMLTLFSVLVSALTVLATLILLADKIICEDVSNILP